MSKHTPGPWYYAENTEFGSTRFYVAQAEGAEFTPHYSDVATVYAETCSGDEMPIQEANARLIAAAPELLEACETFHEWLVREEIGFANRWDRNTEEGEAKWREWYDENLRICALAQVQARAAIAKATGEQ